MSTKTGAPGGPEKPAEPKSPFMAAQELQAEVEQLRAQVARQQAQIEELQGQQAQPAGKLPPAKAGHVWAYTRYPYVVEEYEGGQFRPRTVPKDTAVEVTVLELRIDGLRRFPHLETVEVREQRLAVAQERATAPIREQMDGVAQAFADAAERVKVREQHRAATLQDILNPTRVAAQLPQ